jgi:Uncharacterized phage-associated protein
MYTGLEISRYILNKCIELGRPISNLQLQKLLYYVQGEYIKNTNGSVLFKDMIVAWDYGPSVPDVYYEYNCYSSSCIAEKQKDVDLGQFERDIIDPVIIEKSAYSSWNLVEMTHLEEPWINTHKKGKGSAITIIELRNWFV